MPLLPVRDSSWTFLDLRLPTSSTFLVNEITPGNCAVNHRLIDWYSTSNLGGMKENKLTKNSSWKKFDEHRREKFCQKYFPTSLQFFFSTCARKISSTRERERYKKRRGIDFNRRKLCQRYFSPSRDSIFSTCTS